MPHEDLIPIPADAAARDALLRRVRELAALDHPRVEPVVGAEPRDDGVLVVRRGPGAAADLPAVLAVRGRLTATEASGLLVCVAQGLAALHSAGLEQGGVGAGDVVLDGDGTAMLRPALQLERDGAPSGPGPAGVDAAAHDVHTLAALVAELGGAQPAARPGGRPGGPGSADDETVALQAVLAPALAPDPRVRPEAGTLAAQAADACAHEPVLLPERARLAAAALGVSVRDPAHRSHDASWDRSTEPVARRAVRRPGATGETAVRARAASHRRPAAGDGRTGGSTRGARAARRDASGTRRRLSGVAAAVGVGVVVAGIVVVALEVRQPDAPAVATATTPAGASGGAAREGAAEAVHADPVRDRAEPAAAAAALTRARVALLAGGPGSADEIDLAGSAAHAADSRLLSQVEAAGTQVEGAHVEVHATRTRDRTERTARVEVDYTIGAHVQQAADGATTQVAASGVRSATLDLTWTEGGWRVSAVA
ncbi:hypothetical protein [Isoptericola cucumis]|uniref:Protein kinase domain-containing protein n=2 Tax=Isoptericola cucumis TaxID=1776856 RepID=A0ABQ2BAU0_9MICO|nr:hypothetical protein [Isoptericola cucumis]GGI12129.1 hypothetical protein GCM10007368_39630 [Isoptericola cucumis]